MDALTIECSDARAFLRLCLRAHHNATAREVVQRVAASSAVQWEGVCDLAEAERVGPLIYRALRTAPIPAAALQRLQDSYRRTSLRNLMLLREAGDAVQALTAAGILVIILKGGALAETVYNNPALRQLQDIDVLMHREDLPAALRVLAALGYETPGVEPRAGVVAAYENELLLYKRGRLNVPLAVHWSLFDSPHYQHALPMDWFWETSVTLPVGNAVARTLGLEAQLLHLCGHLLLHHTGEELLWLNDIAELIACNQRRIDWTLAMERAAVCDLVLPMQRVIERVASEWDAPVPGAVRDRLRALTASAREKRVFTWLTTKDRTRMQRLWADFVSLPNWRHRLRFASAYLFPSRAYMRELYGVRRSVLVPLYYPYRWLRGLRGAR